MAAIKILKKLSPIDLPATSYKMTITATATDFTTSKVFVKQRVRNPLRNTFDDIFVAIASPEQVETLNEDAPATNSSYFRTDSIELVGTTLQYLDTVLDDIKAEVQNLIIDFAAFTSLNPSTITIITALSIDTTPAYVLLVE